MSASTDRKKRQEAISSGMDRKSLASREEEKKQKKSKAKWTFGSIVVALLIAAILLLNSSLFYTGVSAVEVGDQSYTTAQFQYYFKTQYYYFVNQYGSYASYFGLDTQSPLKSQECTMLEDGGTWYDYFKQQSLTYMSQITAMSEYAKKNSIALDDTDKADIDSQITEMTTAATNNGYKSLDKYILAAYGRGCNEKLIRQEMERVALAGKAYQTVQDSYKFTDAELEENYQKNKDSFDTFDYDYYLVSADKVETKTDAATGTDTTADNSAVTKETMAAAKAKADKIAAAAKSGDFSAAVKGVVADGEASVNTGTTGSQITSEYGDWLKDASRKAGDITVVESADTGYYVVKFVGRSNNHYQMAQVRHILVKAVASDDGTYTDEAKATAKEKAQKIYDEWKSGAKTEDSFAELATKYTEDEGSKTNGGLYDSIYKGQMVDEFDKFSFAEGRKAGDTALIYGEATGSYAGYHVVYYVGQGDLYSNYLSKNQLVSGKMTTWQSDLVKNYPATEKFAIRFANAV